MARTTTKKKTAAKKKTAKKTSKKKTKKKGDLDDLDADLDAALDSQFDFEDGKPKKPKSLIGLTVQFLSDENELITAKVIEQNGNDISAEDDTSIWETTYKDCEVVTEETEAKPKKESKKAAAATSGRSKKATPEPEDAVDEIDDRIRPRRMVELDKLKVAKAKVRSVDKESEKYKLIKADMKRHGQRDSIRVQAFANLFVVGGHHRLAAALELREESKGKKWTHLECQVEDDVEDSIDRLIHGVIDNEARKAMHWTELARVSQAITKSGKLSQKQLGRLIGKTESQMTRLLQTLTLPKAAREIAATGGGDKGDVVYAEGVFVELATAPKKVQAEAIAAMKAGRPFTIADTRTLTREVKSEEKARKKKKEEGEEEEGEQPTSTISGGSGSSTYTHKTLSKDDVGDYIRATVHREHMVLSFHIDWKKKTFRNFDPVEEIKGMFGAIFESDEVSVESFKALALALTHARDEIAG